MHRNGMAEQLARLLVVYAVSEDRKNVRQLRDKREAVTGLAVTRTALKAAIAALKDRRRPARKARR